MSTAGVKEQILHLLEKEGFLTVRKLSQTLYLSPSSIRRHLSDLQNQGTVRRTHGGVMLAESIDRIPSLSNRMTKNVTEKRKIAKKASALLSDGQSVMLDGSTTAGFMVPYLAKFKNIILFTNNMETALKAIAFGIDTHCIGGRACNKSAVLSGEAAYRQTALIHPDILFFSSQALDADGTISDANPEENYLRVLMLENAAKKVFLCDSSKFGSLALYRLTSIKDLDCAVFDSSWDKLEARARDMLI